MDSIKQFVLPPNPWFIQSRRTAFENKFWRAEHLAVTRPDGSPGDFYVIPRPDCVKLIGLTAEGGIVMIGRWMVPTMQWSFELPGGSPKPHEDLRDAAAREFLSETGYAVPPDAIFEAVGAGHLLNGWFPSKWNAFLVRGVVKVEDATDRALKHGTQAIIEYSVPDVLAMIDGFQWLTCSVDQAVLERAIRKFKLK